jgi:hypothetical protein
LERDGFVAELAYLEDDPVAGSMPLEPTGSSDHAASAPKAILKMRTALEVLSPQTYVKPADLADGEARRIAQFGDRPLPWANGSETSCPHLLRPRIRSAAARLAEKAALAHGL